MTDPVEALFKRVTAGIKPGLDVITALLEALGNPHQKLAVIHVAGTNGKGSVCAMIESVLRASGFKTGLYTSPHLVNFSERFRVNGAEISQDRLEGYIELVLAADETPDQRPATFFEISTAIAFQYFADEGVNVAIIETGMGGRWDATNVVIPLLSVITHIDIDHTNFLGDTIGGIAAEKAGIIKPGRPVISAPQTESAMVELRTMGEPIILSSETVAVAKLVDGASSSVYVSVQRLKIETHSRNLPPINLPLLGECQRENCGVAVTALEILSDLLDIELEFKKGLESVEWGARFQLIGENPLIILDGAHNPSAGRALAKTLKELHPRKRIGFIFGFLDDKESVEFLRELKPLVANAWTISIGAPRGLTAEEAALRCGVAGITAEPTPDALAAAKAWAADEDQLIVITGSLYLKQTLAL